MTVSGLDPQSIPVLTDVVSIGAGSSQFPRTPVAAATAPKEQSAQRQRLVRLLEYIEETERIGRKGAYYLGAGLSSNTPASPTSLVIWQNEIERLPGISFDQRQSNGDDPVWIRIERLHETRAPQAPEDIAAWVDDASESGALFTAPKLRNQRQSEFLEGELLESLDAGQRVALQSSFDNYLREWAAWAEKEKPRRTTIALYVRLFALQQSFEAETAGKPIDLVMGMGVGCWKQDERNTIRYPLITKLVEISLDTQTLALEIRPREADPRMELEAYAETGNPGVAQVMALVSSLLSNDSLDLSPFSPSSFEPILRSAVTHLDANGVFLPDVQPGNTGKPPTPTENFKVSNGWVLFTRPRGSNFLVEDLQRLRMNLSRDIELPDGAAMLVTPPADTIESVSDVIFRGISHTGVSGARDVVRDLYFPKPYNEEQVSIIKVLETQPGVVVQGPPGTGKTHTIANVICHYLATGRRVLVTSKGEPALAVLRDHIPEDIRALSVSLLTNERDGMKQFEHAITSIASEVSRIQPESVEAEIQDLERQIEALHVSLGAIDTDIDAWAAKHMEPIEFRGRKETAESISRYILDQRQNHAWFPDALEWEDVASFDDDFIRQLRQARQSVGENIVDIDAKYLDPETLPSAEEFLEMHRLLMRRDALRKLLDSGKVNWTQDSLEAVEEALSHIRVMEAASSSLPAKGNPHEAWSSQLRSLYLNQPEDPMLEVLDALIDETLEQGGKRKVFVSNPVKAPAIPTELMSKFQECVSLMAKGDVPFGLFSFSLRSVEKLTKEVTVGGQNIEPENAKAWAHVEDFLSYIQKNKTLVLRWNVLAGEMGLPEISGGSETKKLMELVDVASRVRTVSKEADALVAESIGKVFGEGMRGGMDLTRQENLHSLKTLLEARLECDALQAVVNRKVALSSNIGGFKVSIKKGLVEMASLALGSPQADPAELSRHWGLAMDYLRRLQALKPSFDVIAQSCSQIAVDGAPGWAAQLAKMPCTSDLDVLLPANWRDAWETARAAGLMRKIDSHAQLRDLQLRRIQQEGLLTQLYRRMISQRAWLEVYRQATPAIRSALNRYMNAIRMIGKGTGVRAGRYRKEARDAMQLAHKAVPCWIMPHWRISETLPAEVGSFDLVIIDEGSQSDLWALPAMLRGAKLMVVGDDRQVSPDGIGLEEEKIVDLQRRYLRDQVFAAEMSPEKSVYDLARVVFASSHIMLREHFRCVEPIISFSNREFYNGEIMPLRIPRASERLDPPLVDVYVKGGRRDAASGRVNRAEARAIVEEIQSICQDPAMAGRSIGVISLLGFEQAQFIDNLLRVSLDPEKLIAHRIECGDARTFQGKERDIILLSMVVDRDNVVAATKREYQQRFNVAASRARDRMMIFRSVELSDLNPSDLRAKLIGYFNNPEGVGSEDAQDARSRCESEFERRMFDALTSRGYRVQTQVRVGAWRIDMVVEGRDDRRLAIECDGDRYHGPDRWQADMRRQRVLERAGWTFWRCFASTFNLQREAVMDDLLRTLRDMQIEPLNFEIDESEGPVRSSMVERRVIEPSLIDVVETPIPGI